MTAPSERADVSASPPQTGVDTTTVSIDDITLTRELRKILWDAGFRPVPVYTHDKRPMGTNWRALALQDPPACVLAPPQADALNTGILTDGLRAIDIDVDDRQIALAVRELATSLLGSAPTRLRANSGRSLLLYGAADGQPPKRMLKGRLGTIEVLGAGQQFVAFWQHPSGARLEWEAGFPGEVKKEDLIAITEGDVDAFFERVAPLIGAEVNTKANERAAEPPVSAPVSTAISDVIAALSVIPGDDGDYDRWVRIGLATWSATGGAAEGRAAWE